MQTACFTFRELPCAWTFSWCLEKKVMLFQSITKWINNKNYRLVSLLPISGKLLEKLTFNSIFSVIDTRYMFLVHQSEFRPGDSCVHQLISIVHDIYNSFDIKPSLEVRAVFSISLKHLIGCGIKLYNIKLNVWV